MSLNVNTKVKTVLFLSGLALAAEAMAAANAKYFSIADGSVQLELHPNGEFAAAAYPKSAEALVQLKSIRTFNTGATLAEACGNMPARIKMTKSSFLSEASKANYRDGLLNLNQIVLNVASPRWLQPGAIEKDVFHAAGLNSVFHWNPLKLKSRDLVFKIDPSASSLEVESADALGKRLQAFKGILLSPAAPLATASLPLVCDLQAGRIQILLNLSAEHKDFEDFAWPEGKEPVAVTVEETVEPTEPVLTEGTDESGVSSEESAATALSEASPTGVDLPSRSPEGLEAGEALALPEPRPDVRLSIGLQLKWQD